MTTNTPTCFPLNPRAIFELLAGGAFSDLSDENRECNGGASDQALEYVQPGFLIIVDCEDAGGLHVELTDDEGTTWGLNMVTGRVEMLSTVQD